MDCKWGFFQIIKQPFIKWERPDESISEHFGCKVFWVGIVDECPVLAIISTWASKVIFTQNGSMSVVLTSLKKDNEGYFYGQGFKDVLSARLNAHLHLPNIVFHGDLDSLPVIPETEVILKYYKRKI